MDASLAHKPDPVTTVKTNHGIPPFLVIENAIVDSAAQQNENRARKIIDEDAESTAIWLAGESNTIETDTVTLLALYLLGLYRVTQTESFAIPLYVLNNNNRHTVKTLCFFAGETLPQIRERVRQRLEVPGTPISAYSEGDNPLPNSSCAAALLPEGHATKFPQDLLPPHGRNLCQTILTVVNATGGEPSYTWLTRKTGQNDKQNPPLKTFFERLIDVHLRIPGIDLHGVDLLSKEEILQQQGFSSDIIEAVSHTPVYRQVERFAENTPDANAVSVSGRSLTYRQLNSLSNLIAREMATKGVTHGNYVGVLIQPSPFIFASILAIHKLGAIYVPLDASFPESRLKKIIETAPPTLILHDASGEKMIARLGVPAFNPAHHISNKDLADNIPNPSHDVSIGSASHVFFTSGTTGNPKGILATHKNFSHSLYAGVRRYGFTSADRFIAVARCTFSISMFEYFTALTLGARVELIAPDTISDKTQFIARLRTASVVHMVPSLLRQILDYQAPAGTEITLPSIRYLLTGGDMVPAETLEKSRSIFTQARIFVNYGSSEISCMGCTYEIDRDQAKIRTKIGRPHPNMKVLILDKNKNKLPLGSCGELHFSGDGVVPGYINNGDLNRLKFIDIDGERFFAIGDIGRFDHQGNIELLGREDFQLQINGIRIEPPEIEYRLKQLPSIRDCVVVGRSISKSKNISLIAYIVKRESLPTPNQLTDHLRSHLPEYMCPSAYIALTELPTNHNGKIDRAQLPEPTVQNILSVESTTGKRTKLEEELIEIWERTFDLNGLHQDHDFFEIGGTSLDAISMLTTVHDTYGRKISLPHFLSNRTVKKLARALSINDDSLENEHVTVLKDGDADLPPLFCLNGSIQYRELASTIDIPNQVVSVTLPEEEEIISDGSMTGAFSEISDFHRITQKYLDAILRYQPEGPYLLTGASFGGLIAFEVARDLIRSGKRVDLVGLYDTWVPGYREKAKPVNRVLIGLKKIHESGLSQLRSYGLRVIKRLSGRQKVTHGPENTDIRDVLRSTALAKFKLRPQNQSVLLFNAIDRPRYYGERNEDHLGWKRYASSVEVCKVHGDHIGILKYPHVLCIAEKLEERISALADCDGADRAMH